MENLSNADDAKEWLAVCLCALFCQEKSGAEKKTGKNFIVDISQVDGERVNF